MRTSIITAIVAIIATYLLTSCTVTTSPDGTVTKSPDYNAWLTIAEMVYGGVVPPVAIPVEHK